MACRIRFSATEPVQSEKMFVGRDQLRSLLSDSPRSVIILGEVKIGKTSLLHRIREDLLGIGGILPVLISLENPVFNRPSDIYRNIVHHLRSGLDAATLEEIPGSPQNEPVNVSDLIEILQALEISRNHCAVALLIDNIERTSRLAQRSMELYTDLRLLMENAPPSNRVIVIATSGTSFLSLESTYASGLIHRLQPHYLEALDSEECQRLASISDRIERSPDRGTILKFIFEQTGGHPCLTQDLIVRALEPEITGISLLDAFRREARIIARNGTSYFADFVQNINLEELTFLEALALNLTVDEWPLPPRSIERFRCTGLLRVLTSGKGLTPSCKLFFRWLKNNASKLIQFSKSFLPRANDPASLCELLARSLPRAIGKRKIKREKEIQDLIQAILAAHELPFQREATRGEYQGKRFRVDFAIDEMALAVEVKIVTDVSRISKLVDEVITDREAYLTSFATVIFLIYDTTGRVAQHKFFSLSMNPYARFVICEERS